MAIPTVLSLFSGVGGIDYGLRQAGFRSACYVENDPYAVRVLQARVDGGQLDEAPVWDDARTFDGKEWRDEIDLVAGGFPCQDVSTAGKRAGIGGARSGLWAEMHRTVREVRPRFVLCENVPGLLSSGMGRVLGDLASLRYDAIWTVLSAAEVGAPHLRRRVFIVAHPHEDGRDGAGLPDFAWEEGALLAGGGEGEERLMLPTPSATPYGSNRGGAVGRVGKERPSLETMARTDMWPTPQAFDGCLNTDFLNDPEKVRRMRTRNDTQGASVANSLAKAVKVGMWPTPGAGDAQKAGLNPAMMKRVQARLDGSVPCAPSGANYQESLPERVALEEAKGNWPTPQAGADNPAAHNAMSGDFKKRFCERAGIPMTGQLNPAWVEWLVGVPVGWTDLECASPEYPEGLSFEDAWAYDPYPAVPRVAKGVPDRAKRLRCLGNIVVPQCAYSIGARIMETIEHG